MSRNSNKDDKNPSIIGAGLVVLDIILHNGDTVPIFRAGGTCGNVLSGLSYLGWNSIAISRAGLDYAGKLMMKDLSGCGVDISRIECGEKLKTPRIIEKLTSTSTQQKHTFLLRCPACHEYLPRFQSPKLDAIDPVLAEHTTPSVFFFDRVSPAILKMAKKYRDRGSLILFEPNNRRNPEDIESAIALSHVLKYSAEERKLDSPNKDEHIWGKLNPPLIIVTLGREGLMFRLSKNGKWHHQDSFSINKIEDACGAGDWCTVGFLYYLNKLAASQSISITDALRSYKMTRLSLQYAQMLSSVSCGFVGARGLSDRVESKALIQSFRRLLTNKTDINTIITSVSIKKHHALRTSRQKTDRVACPICLLS